MFFPKNGEQRGSDRWDSASKAWVRADEWQARQWDREDRVFARMANQGELCCPMLISDGLGLHGLQSQADGKPYDSKSEMRKHYRQAGMVEVGNDGPSTRFSGGDKPPVDPQAKKRRLASIDKAFNRMEMPPV